MNIYELEAVIRDPAKSDADVRAALDQFDLEAYYPNKQRDQLSDAEWQVKMSEAQLNWDIHVGQPLIDCRPGFHERLHEEAMRGHRECCGGGCETEKK